MPSSPRFLEGWSGKGKTNPRAAAGRLSAAPCSEVSPRIAGSAGASRSSPSAKARLGERSAAELRPGSRVWTVVKRVAVGVYIDGFIHAGNLAYLALLALFPFFIVAAAIARAVRRRARRAMRAVNAFLYDHAARRRRRAARADPRRAGRRAPAACSGSARWSACGPSAASSRRSATSSAAPTASTFSRPFWRISARLDRDHHRRGGAAR